MINPVVRKGIKSTLATLVGGLMICAGAMAGQTEQTITKSVEALTGQAFEGVRKSGMADLYEVVTPRGVLFADGSRIPGFATADVLEKKLKEIHRD